MSLLSDLDCRRAKPGRDLYDGDNLVLRVGVKRKTWALVWRDAGRVRKVRLGRYPKMGLTVARDAADAGMVRVRAGLTPIALPADLPALPPPKPPTGPTVEAILRTYLTRHVWPTSRSPAQIEEVVNLQLKQLHSRPVADLDRQGIIRFLDSVVDERGPASAYRAGTILHAALRYGVKRGDLAADPMHLVPLPSGGPSRDRVLSDAELAPVWGSQVVVWSRLARVLLMTGLRLREAANAAGSEIEGEQWLIPSSRMKGGRPHVVPLFPALQAELGDAAGMRWIFRSPRRFDQPAKGFYRGIEALQRATETSGWVWHDLRRTCASGLQRLGAPSEVIESVLSHRRPGVSSVYQRHEFLQERRDWLQRWSGWLSGSADRSVQ